MTLTLTRRATVQHAVDAPCATSKDGSLLRPPDAPTSVCSYHEITCEFHKLNGWNDVTDQDAIVKGARIHVDSERQVIRRRGSLLSLGEHRARWRRGESGGSGWTTGSPQRLLICLPGTEMLDGFCRNGQTCGIDIAKMGVQ